jgi:hypothetical protein
VDGQIHSNVKLPVNGNLDHHETTTLQHRFFFVRKDPFEIVDGPLPIKQGCVTVCVCFHCSQQAVVFYREKWELLALAAAEIWEFSLLFSQRMKVTPLDLLVEECQPVSFPE